MLRNKFKLNDDKTEIIALTGPRRSLHVSELTSLYVGDESVSITPSIRLLGCDLDYGMTFKGHVINVTENCIAKLRNRADRKTI